MKSYYFSEEHEMFRESLRDFLKNEIMPHINEWEKAGEVPREMYQRFGEMGYLGLALPEVYGGMDADLLRLSARISCWQ
jgi:acyl-CoA dehydrogenase